MIDISYIDLVKIADIMNNSTRLKLYSKYYMNKNINGLNYVNFRPKNNTLSISRPNHETHHLVTSYLIFKKNNYSINTARKEASDLKKFLDYIMIWDIDLLNCDLYVVLLGFIDYLRIIEPNPFKFKNSIRYSYIEKIPVNRDAESLGAIISIGIDEEGFMSKKEFGELKYMAIKNIISTVIQYIQFLKERTQKFKNIQTESIPMRIVLKESIVSGTTGKNFQRIFDIDSILSSCGLENKKIKASKSLDLKVFSLEEVDLFIDSIRKDDYQNKFLFTVLKLFGLRRAEAARLKIDLSKVTTKLMHMTHDKGIQYIKDNLKGDIEYNSKLKRWVCKITEDNNIDYRCQIKTGCREIPLVLSEGLFEYRLFYALVEREIVMKLNRRKHNYLFISKDSIDRGNPIYGTTIGSRYRTMAIKLYDKDGVDLTQYSPHSFRHFFATYLIREKNQPISDVSRWLGHSGEDVTKDTYYHYIPIEDEEKNVVEDMKNKFGEAGKQKC